LGKGVNILDRSSLRIENKLPYFEIPEWTKLGWVRHAFLTRQGGVSLPPYHSLNLSDRNGDSEETVPKNKERVATVFNFDPKRLILLDQVHQDKILLLKEPIMNSSSPLEYDALITNSTNIFLGILTADCLPILMVDPKRKVIAAVHAGRQGTGLHITPKVLEKMGEVYRCIPGELLIAMGPSIRPCCYEIDEKVFRPEWEDFSSASGVGKWVVDLAQINIAQMKREGIEEEQISWINLCTHCHSDLFFSYRKESLTGRQLSFIGIE
jgi:YfiH family protein